MPLRGMDAFSQRFSPHRALLVGADGIPLDEFLMVPAHPLVRETMNGIVPRTCTEVPAREADQNWEQYPQLLEAFRYVSAYVLLGDPGAGKTTAFKIEHEAIGQNTCLISARNFLALDRNSHPEWAGKTLFIDGLDEVRVGSIDVRPPLDAILRHLDALGRPPFRLSCREADWLGANDLTNLATVSKDSSVTVLRLNPLTDSDIIQILNGYSGIDNAQTFIVSAKERGVRRIAQEPTESENAGGRCGQGRRMAVKPSGNF